MDDIDFGSTDTDKGKENANRNNGFKQQKANFSAAFDR